MRAAAALCTTTGSAIGAECGCWAAAVVGTGKGSGGKRTQQPSPYVRASGKRGVVVVMGGVPCHGRRPLEGAAAQASPGSGCCVLLCVGSSSSSLPVAPDAPRPPSQPSRPPAVLGWWKAVMCYASAVGSPQCSACALLFLPMMVVLSIHACLHVHVHALRCAWLTRGRHVGVRVRCGARMYIICVCLREGQPHATMHSD